MELSYSLLSRSVISLILSSYSLLILAFFFQSSLQCFLIYLIEGWRRLLYRFFDSRNVFKLINEIFFLFLLLLAKLWWISIFTFSLRFFVHFLHQFNHPNIELSIETRFLFLCSLNRNNRLRYILNTDLHIFFSLFDSHLILNFKQSHIRILWVVSIYDKPPKLIIL